MQAVVYVPSAGYKSERPQQEQLLAGKAWGQNLAAVLLFMLRSCVHARRASS